MHRYLLVLSTLVCILISTVGLAQPTRPNEHKWEVSIFAGSSHRGDGIFITPFSDTAVPPAVTSNNVGLSFASGYAIGARVTENLGKYFGAELEYSLSNQPLVFTNLTPDIARVSVDHRVHQITYVVLVYGLPRSSRLRPYGVVGPGVSLYEFFGDNEDDAVANGVNLKDRWKFGATFGGGVKYRVAEKFGVRFDVRDHMTGVPDFGLPALGTAAAPGFRPDGRLQNWQFTIGLSYLFSDR